MTKSIDSIVVYATDKGPSTIKGLKFTDGTFLPITDVIDNIKDGSLNIDNVELKGKSTFSIENEFYKELSKKYELDEIDVGLFYYEQYDSNTMSMHAKSSFRGAYCYFKDNGVAVVPLKYIDGCEVKVMDSLMSNLSEGADIGTLDFTHLDTRNVVNMQNMFNGLNDVSEFIFGKLWDTQKVTNMSYMFSGCSKFEKLDLLPFNTENVTDMSYMFHKCSKMKILDLLTLKTENVTDVSFMFSGCSNTLALNFMCFNVCKVPVSKLRYLFVGVDRSRCIMQSPGFFTNEQTLIILGF